MRYCFEQEKWRDVMERKYKRLEELELWDDFMFGAVMSNKELCKTLLELILHKKIKDIRYPELQKVMDWKYEAKSIRLDVYIEDITDTVYNIEIQATDQKNLPKRSRYYQDMIDLNILDKGEDFNQLKNSYVIFICKYDPFEKRKCMYWFENICVDDLSLKLGDDSAKIIINPYGDDAEKYGKAFKALMGFLKSGRPTDDYTESLEKEVGVVKASEEWRREYMTLLMRDQENIEKGKEIGEKLGDLSRGIRVVKSNMSKYSVHELASLLEFDCDMIQKMIEQILAHPEWDEKKIASEIIEEEK